MGAGGGPPSHARPSRPPRSASPRQRRPLTAENEAPSTREFREPGGSLRPGGGAAWSFPDPSKSQSSLAGSRKNARVGASRALPGGGSAPSALRPHPTRPFSRPASPWQPAAPCRRSRTRARARHPAPSGASPGSHITIATWGRGRRHGFASRGGWDGEEVGGGGYGIGRKGGGKSAGSAGQWTCVFSGCEVVGLRKGAGPAARGSGPQAGLPGGLRQAVTWTPGVGRQQAAAAARRARGIG